MIAVKNGNNRMKERLYVLALMASLLFIAVDKVILPTVNSGKLADAVYAQGKQIAVLEELVISLRPLPTEVAGLKATMDSVKASIVRIELNINKLER